jgi:antitoxin MazE
MANVIRTRLVKIGNSQGIRIPRVVLDQLHITDTIELELQDDQLIVRSTKSPRTEWRSAFQHMAAHTDDRLLDPEYLPTSWEESEWEW